MHPPDEIMVEEFLPSLRQLVSRTLKSQGFSQSRISSMLGITQASVSLYQASDPGKAYAALASVSLEKEDADRYSALLADDVKRNAVDGVETLTTLWTELLGRGSVCARHRSLYPSLADCDVCIKEYGQERSDRSEVVSDVAKAVRRLEASPSFVSVMPEVSVNVACLAGEGDSPADVVAVPGRIVKARGRARAMLPPEPGASRHLAKVLLLVRERRPEVRSCTNLRYDPRMAKILRRLRMRTLEIGGYPLTGPGDPTVQALARRLATARDPFDAVVDSGGNGIEPNVYLFAKGVGEIADLALSVSKLYSAR